MVAQTLFYFPDSGHTRFVRSAFSKQPLQILMCASFISPPGPRARISCIIKSFAPALVFLLLVILL